MIHSRPGFAPRHNDKAPAKLNSDKVPALNRKPKDEALSTLDLDARTAKAMEKLTAQRHAAALAAGPEILVNPAPTDPPLVLEPGK